MSQPTGGELPQMSQCLGTGHRVEVSRPGQPVQLLPFCLLQQVLLSTYHVLGTGLGTESDKQSPCLLGV